MFKTRIDIQKTEKVVKLNQINKIKQKYSEKLVLDQFYIPQFKTLPRQKYPRYQVHSLIAQNEWDINNSIFKNWFLNYNKRKEDNTNFLNKCFENDWILNKLQKFVKNQYDQINVKEILRLNYYQLKEIYKIYSSVQPIGKKISKRRYLDLINDLDIIGPNKMTSIDANLKFVSTISANLKGNHRMPERGIVRCQFMELLVRFADELFLKTQICDNIGQATKLIIQDHYLPLFCKYDSQNFRNKLLWNENCDKAHTFYKQIQESIFKNFSIKKVLQGSKKFMCLDEFKDIFQQCSLYDDNFLERDAHLAYNLSMMTQIDEINDDRFIQMSIIEFQEAISRSADKLSLIFYNNQNDQMTYDQRLIRPLHEKIEGLYKSILKLAEIQVKNLFKVSQNSIFEILQNNQEESE